MKVEIKCDADDLDKHLTLVLEDTGLDNDAFISLAILDDNREEGLGITISLLELMPAIIAFDAKRSRRLSEEDNSHP